VKLAVGDVVVYGTHGIGRIAAREEQVRLGEAQDVVVVELEDGLTVTLPLARAQEHLRPLAGKDDLRRVQDTLRVDREFSTSPWLARRRETVEKLAAGNLVQLAEIVCEGAQRERMRQASGSKSQLSPGEREIFVKARKLLCDEIALALGLQQDAAHEWIDEQLERPAT
jgi:CarD family transcriptional regulator